RLGGKQLRHGRRAAEGWPSEMSGTIKTRFAVAWLAIEWPEPSRRGCPAPATQLLTPLAAHSRE
ncbi:MAG: hypothetical protein ACKOJF_07020, partial [Planctomycetaceae bacterium]